MKFLGTLITGCLAIGIFVALTAYGGFATYTNKTDIKGEWAFVDNDKETLVITITDEFISVPIPIDITGPLKFKYEVKYQGKWALVTLLPNKEQEGLIGKEKMSVLLEADGSDKFKAICIGPNPNQLITRKNDSVEIKS